jgi:hypothetical protein
VLHEVMLASVGLSKPCRPASRKRRQKGNPVSGGGITVHSYSWGIGTSVTSKCGDLALQVGGVSDETVK